jgi:hypothetical protein
LPSHLPPSTTYPLPYPPTPPTYYLYLHTHHRTHTDSFPPGAQVDAGAQVTPLVLPPPSETHGSGPEMRTEMQKDDWMEAYMGVDVQSTQLQEELQAQLQLLL